MWQWLRYLERKSVCGCVSSKINYLYHVHTLDFKSTTCTCISWIHKIKRMNSQIILSSQILQNRHRCCCYFLGRWIFRWFYISWLAVNLAFISPIFSPNPLPPVNITPTYLFTCMFDFTFRQYLRWLSTSWKVSRIPNQTCLRSIFMF